MSIIHADLRCNDTEVFKNPCVIEEVVELPAHDFSAFSHHLTDDYPFIHKMAARLTCDSRGVHHCLLVLCEGQDDGILVKSEGYDYARYHSYLSNARQNPIDAGYVIFVAEVASTCNEALLMEYLLNKTTDKRERAFLINHFLEQFKGTLYRQTMFAEFELNIGRMVAEGKTLTTEMLCAEYKRLNELYAATGQIGFRVTQRLDARLVQQEGMKCLAMKAGS